MSDTAPDQYAWMAEAECKSLTPDQVSELYFPVASGNNPSRSPYRIGSKDDPYAIARTICARCPVSAPCLKYGLGERDGMFGGMDERQRAMVRKQRRMPLPLR
jgi:hypothetical protein